MGAGQSMTSNYGVSGSPGYDLDFTRYNTALEQAFVLPYKFGLKFSADGQYSDDVLPSSEQVAYGGWRYGLGRSEEHTSELQSLMRISYAVFCLKKKKQRKSKLTNMKTTLMMHCNILFMILIQQM